MSPLDDSALWRFGLFKAIVSAGLFLWILVDWAREKPRWKWRGGTPVSAFSRMVVLAMLALAFLRPIGAFVRAPPSDPLGLLFLGLLGLFILGAAGDSFFDYRRRRREEKNGRRGPE